MPALLVAVTVQLYSEPLVKPLTTIGLLVALALTTTPEAVHAAVYLVTGLVPVRVTGAVKATVTCASPAVAETMAGAVGTKAT